MVHDDYARERKQWDRLLVALERAAGRLDRVGQPLPKLRGILEQILELEREAISAADNAETDRPALPACIEEHDAARASLDAMEQSLSVLEDATRAAARRFAQAAAEFIRLHREHLQADDQIMSGAAAAGRRSHAGLK